MSHRIISRLGWAQECDPVFKPSKLKGARARGLAYQRQVEKELAARHPATKFGQWFVFNDNFGRGHCQPDAFEVREDFTLLWEMKLTQTHDAFLQMAQLYVPVLEYVFKRPVMTVQVCKVLRYAPESSLETFDKLIPGNHTWHFFGR